jgi:hypothetical protein
MLRLHEEYGVDRCVYIFCDAPTHRLVCFALLDANGNRHPLSVKTYGIEPTDYSFVMQDSAATKLTFVQPAFNSEGCLREPVDVAVSSCGHYFDPDSDFVLVLDKGNHRFVELLYDQENDSLLWKDSFGAANLRMPTAIDYADYGDYNRQNDDIYITDAALCKIIRFSKDGQFETSYGGWGLGLADIAYPTGIAISGNHIYVTDSHNHRISRYASTSSGPIIPDLCQYIKPKDRQPPLPFLTSVDTDPDGNVYVTDEFHHDILILNSDLNLLTTFGERGYEPGEFDYPEDIYIDGYEMQVCERYADSSGIQSFSIIPGSPKREAPPLPGKFSLAQNYPNPFNSNTTIRFELPEPADVEIVIYDILGRKVITLDSEKMSAGTHSRIWNGRNQLGQTVSSGVYFYRLAAGRNVAVKKLLLLK